MGSAHMPWESGAKEECVHAPKEGWYQGGAQKAVPERDRGNTEDLLLDKYVMMRAQSQESLHQLLKGGRRLVRQGQRGPQKGGKIQRTQAGGNGSKSQVQQQ